MPEVFASFLASLLRHALTGLAVYFVTHGYFTQSQAENYIAAAVAAVLGLGWSYWQKYRARILFLTGLAARPGTDPSAVTTAVSRGAGVPMAAIFVPVLLLAGIGMSGCASVNGKLAAATSQAIQASEQLHCSTAGAPQPPLCLNDGQFQRVNADLAKVSAAGAAYTEIAMAAQQAKHQPPADALVTLVGAISAAMADIAQAVGTSSAAILQQLEKALHVL